MILMRDGVCGDVDNCPGFQIQVSLMQMGMLFGDVCDSCQYDADNDIDGDTSVVIRTIAPMLLNADQADMDGDGVGNVCDDDADGDGFTNNVDCNDLNPNINPQACDIRNDGIDQDCDGVDRTKGKPCVTETDEGLKERACSDGVDNDNDGFVDCADSDCVKKKECR